MANRATVTYNGKTISTEDRDGSFNVTYNGSTIATVGAGQTKTLNCANQVMKTNVVVGGKTLNCAKYKMATNVVVSVVSLFPSAPSSYNLIGTYTASQTWTAPENGYFKIEVFGASGKGANGSSNSSQNKGFGGGGGGGGGYSCSQGVTLNKGDTIVLTIGGVGATTSAVVNSSHNNSFDHTLQVTSGANGGGSGGSGTAGGSGGVASGGKTTNTNGGTGGTGESGSYLRGAAGGAGGAGANGAPNGGNGESIKGLFGGASAAAAGSGSAGFFKIYRGNTNVTGGNADLPAYDVVLANNSWETISQIARLGKASEIWNIGDTKPMTVAGSTYNMQIVAFDHYDVADSASYGRAKAGIVFQYVELPQATEKWEQSKANVNDWITNYSDVKNIIPVIKYPVLNYGASAVTMYEAKGIMASEMELFGTNSNTNIPEGTQYPYYAIGNSKAKNLLGSSTKGAYWTRTMMSSTNTGAVVIDTNGTTKTASIQTSYYAAPVFCL